LTPFQDYCRHFGLWQRGQNVAKRSQTEIDKSLLKERREERLRKLCRLFSANKMQKKGWAQSHF
jgi:hypothetical protein